MTSEAQHLAVLLLVIVASQIPSENRRVIRKVINVMLDGFVRRHPGSGESVILYTDSVLTILATIELFCCVHRTSCCKVLKATH